MKFRAFIFTTILVFLSCFAFSQVEPILTKTDYQKLQQEYEINKFLNINLKRTYLMEVSGAEITGRKALVSEQYYNKNGTPSKLIMFDSVGNQLKYNLYKFDENRLKTEEIYFEANNSLRGGFALEHNENGQTTATYLYNQNSEIVSKQVFSYDKNENIIEAYIYNSENQLSGVRKYYYDKSFETGKIKAISRHEPQNHKIDSLSFKYNKNDEVIEKLFYDENSVLLQKLQYNYNNSGALTNTIEINYITKKTRLISYSYDIYENIESIIESVNDEIISFLRFEYFSKKED
ncbi:MAG: hypothetical protein GX879_02780 [Bacteroidales bacterium]|nr:hypothetical protein [Bacteroidales bacterium]